MGARFRGLALRATLILAACVIWASSAGAATPVATLSAESPISAGGGWLLWSVQTHGGWALEAFHDGKTSALAVALRPQPFDVKVGTSSSGAAVATYSRCAKTPKEASTGNEGDNVGGDLVEPNTGAGCRIHVLELQSGRERTVPIPTVSGVSDTTPSMWHGAVAFARKAPGHGRTSQVMLWSPKHPQQLLTLRHGGVPTPCEHPNTCDEPAGGEVQAMSFDGQLAAFVWKPEGPDTGDGAWEDRVDYITSGRAALVRSMILTESCISDGPEEENWPDAPLLEGGSVLFPGMTRGECYKRDGGLLVGYAGGHLTEAKPLLVLAGLARDGRETYALLAQKPLDEVDPDCTAALPCTLQTVQLPKLKPSNDTSNHPYDY